MLAALIYNPHSGTNRTQRPKQIQAVVNALETQGYRVESAATTGPGMAGQLAADAVRRGAQIVFACGGDGTIHEVLQGLMTVPTAGAEQMEPVVLGIIPLGSANALARDLGLSTDPVKAVQQLRSFTSQSVPVGLVEMQGSDRTVTRWFTVMTGTGPAGALVYKMLTDNKRHLGRMTYYLRAAKLFCTKRFGAFEIGYKRIGTDAIETVSAVSAMTIRIGDLGGVFSPLSRGATLTQPHLRLIIVRPPGWLSLPLWFAMAWTRTHRLNPFVQTIDVDEFSCQATGQSQVDVQADGEWLGRIPIRVRLVPDKLRLLMPADR